MSKSDDRKVQSKMRNWQSISRNHGKKSLKKEKNQTAKGIEAQEEAKGHNLNTSRSTRLKTKIKTKEDRLSNYI